MKRPWYYHMLLSYLPIFFLITSLLFFLFFQEINTQSKNDAEKANEVLIQATMDKIENSMEALDYGLAHFSIYNATLYSYLQSSVMNNVMLNTQMLKEFAEFKRQYPIIDSLYFIRSQDQTVFTEKYIFQLQDFPDKDYIEYLQKDQKSMLWSAPRTYIDFNKSRNVISIAKYVFLSKGDPCIIVVNVNTETIRAMSEQVTSPGKSFVSIETMDGVPIFTNEADHSKKKAVLSESKSDYLGWKFHGGIVNGEWMSMLSRLSSLWMILGITTVIMGILSIIYITRKNYEPLERVVAALHSLANEKKDVNVKVKGKRNVYEFAVIESAFANMLHKNAQLEKQKEPSDLRKRYFIHSVLEGTHRVSKEELSSEMKRFRMPADSHEMCVLLIEIDDYAKFEHEFPKSDQELLKYAIYNAALEIFQKHRLGGIADWVTDRRLACILVSGSSLQEQREQLIKTVEEILGWIKNHLPCSATGGVGSSISQVSGISDSYKDAQTALKHKMVQGAGTVISFGDRVARPRTEMFQLLQTIHSMVHLYRLGNKEWTNKFFELFDEARSKQFVSDDIISLLNYMIFQLDRAISELGASYKEPWKEKGMQALTDVLEREEMLSEIMDRFYETLSGIQAEIERAKELKGYDEILQAIREYIENNYTNPDLSLDQLSDAFHVNAKYLSQLFKVNFGERFMEFLTQLRIEQAKVLLIETEDTVQAISGKVGYANVVTFMRSFKKLSGQSPGDFRKNARIL